MFGLFLQKVVESQEAVVDATVVDAPVDDAVKELKDPVVVEPVEANEGEEVDENGEGSAEEEEEQENGEEEQEEVGEENVVEYGKRKSVGDEAQAETVDVSPKKLKTCEEFLGHLEEGIVEQEEQPEAEAEVTSAE